MAGKKISPSIVDEFAGLPLAERHRLSKMHRLIQQYAAQAREYHRRGDVVLRDQVERDIMEASPTVAYAREVIRRLYEATAAQ